MQPYFFLSIPAIFSLLISCGSSPNNESDAANYKNNSSVSIDGSSTVFPITEAVAEEFRKQDPATKVTVGISETGGGFKKFARGVIDISNASRVIKESEKEDCKKNGVEFIKIAIALDGLAVITNISNNWADEISTTELERLWQSSAQEKVISWNQVNSEWPNKEIHLFGPGTASGTYDYFSEKICVDEGGTRGDYTASEDDNVLVQGIARDKYGLGFFGLAYYNENKKRLKLLAINNGDTTIYPSFESIKNGIYTPLTRKIYIYISKDAAARPEIQAFVNFYISNAKELSTEVGYIPLSDDEYDHQSQRFAEFCKGVNKN